MFDYCFIIMKYYSIYIYPYIDNLYNIFFNKFKLFLYNYIEPDDKNWDCYTIISNDDGKYYEYYYHKVEYYDENSILYIQKINNQYYLYDNELYNNKMSYEITEKINRSSIFFLSITILQNDLVFDIKLKKSECIIGNKLFSKKHIARYINYDNKWKWIRFNIHKPYKIILIDYNMNKNIINEKQYIILYDMYYTCNDIIETLDLDYDVLHYDD